MRRCRAGLFGLALMALAAASSLATAAEPEPTPCEVEYLITPHYDRSPRTLDVAMSFPANGRTETFLDVQSSWSGIENFAASMKGWRGVGPGTRVDPADKPYRFRVAHPATGSVRVEFQALASLVDPDARASQEVDEWYRTQIGKDWFQFFGYSVLPVIDVGPFMQERDVCLSFAEVKGPLIADRVVASASDTVRLRGSRRAVWHAFYAGGEGWRTLERPSSEGVIRFALRGAFDFDQARFVEQAATLIAAQRRFWGDSQGSPAWWVVTPNHHDALSGGTVVNGSTVLSVNRRFFMAGNNGFQFLVGHEALHQWIPHRFGSVSLNGDGSTYWFSEGFTEHYAHRLLLETGVWTREQYATAMTRALQRYWRSPSRNHTLPALAPRFDTELDAANQFYLRGEVLAMRWAAALRGAGGPSLDDLMRGLLLPPTSEPQNQPAAVERLFAALKPWLGDAPRDDVRAFMVEGRDLPLVENLLPSGFALSWLEQPRRVDGREVEGSLERVPVVSPDAPG